MGLNMLYEKLKFKKFIKKEKRHFLLNGLKKKVRRTNTLIQREMYTTKLIIEKYLVVVLNSRIALLYITYIAQTCWYFVVKRTHYHTMSTLRGGRTKN